jgi:hypothetical protein
VSESNGAHRLDRIEEGLALLTEHGIQLNKRLERLELVTTEHGRQIDVLRQVAHETNERTASLISAIGDYIRAQGAQ